MCRQPGNARMRSLLGSNTSFRKVSTASSRKVNLTMRFIIEKVEGVEMVEGVERVERVERVEGVAGTLNVVKLKARKLAKHESPRIFSSF